MGRLLALPGNQRLCYMSVTVVGYDDTATITAVKSFIVPATGFCTIKPITVGIVSML
jgi:hypothetical protein